ncbi:MAG TPA: N-acetyltransferase [Dehalococcoidia bacterium]|jgi:ribosomal-protein-serine acetyltransferase|nr:N-acetyltransferase [Dehalococcoidia bacterium]
MTSDKITSAKTPLLTVDNSLVLRPAELDDAEIYLQLVADNYERLAKWHSASQPSNLIEERRKAQAADLKRGEGGKGHWWLIEAGPDLAGTIALHSISARDRSALVGYWLAEGYTGRGIMTASLRATLDWAFTDLGLIRVEIQCATINLPSCAVPERLGIRRESTRRQSQIRNNDTLDMASYVAFADNWPPKPPSPALPSREIRVDDEILLRQYTDYDRDDMWKALDTGRDYVSKYLPWMSAYNTEDDHTRGYNTRGSEQNNFDGSGGYIIEYKGEFAGTVGSGTPKHDNVIEVGYWLRQDLQGRGIMTRSVAAIITMLFVEVGMHRITIRATTSNLRSRGIPERLGFKHEGTMRDGSYVNNVYMDLEIYSMLDHEWLARSKNA